MRSLMLIGLFLSSVLVAGSQVTTPRKSDVSVLARGLDHPHAVCVADDGAIFIADRTGIRKLTNGQPQPFSTEQARAIHAWKKLLYLCTERELKSIDEQGKVKVLVTAEKFRDLAKSDCTLTAIAINEYGMLFVAAVTHDQQGCIFRVIPPGRVSLEIPPGKIPELRKPTALAIAGETALLVQSEHAPGAFLVCQLQKRTIGTVPLGPVVGLAYDFYGRVYGINSDTKSVQVIARPGAPARNMQLYEFQKPAGLTYDHVRQRLLVADADGGTLVALPQGDPAEPVDETPLPLATEPAFPKIQWAGWEPANEKGIVVPHRPIVLTHANDASRRTFVATQHGVIHVFPNRPDVSSTKIFLDLQDRVIYDDKKNEEGFLGLAFHPKYKENGEFFVYYTKKPGLLSVISRFRVSKDDPERADIKSEEVLITIKQPYWNHNGGTIVFGPDGYLYIGLGDGGAANDPLRAGQDLRNLLGKILRIDVDRKDGDKPYAIPKDNPFINHEGAAKENFAFGIRNVWRMAFDRQTGQGWFADVGQNLYEEINLLQKGGNYGWNPRESFHPFGDRAVDVNAKMIEPIWEYHHRVGKSITGGPVYRGKQFPELAGKYLYADYVSAKIWALNYDFQAKRVVGHQEIANRGLPIMSFGEDEDGEVYLTTFSASGQGVFRIVRKQP
jgi:glucose/arabinose dehydrogenase